MLGSRALSASDLAPRDLARLWSRVEVHGRSYGRRGRCWPWTGPIQKSGGYGIIQINGRAELAHRVAFAALFGEAPADASIRHYCDNPACCQGGHLISGTNLENVWDRVSRGRSNTSPLDAATVRYIRQSRDSQRWLAEQFGVSQGTISNIVNRKTWRHVT